MDVCAAVDLGATNLRVAKVSRDGRILEYKKCSVGECETGEEIVDWIISFIEKLFANDSVQATGISTAGPIDKKNGEVVHSPNMRCDKISLVRPLEKHFGVPVVMSTDCKSAILAEASFGSAKGYDTVVYITFSTGIGAGVISHGHLLEGVSGNASEVGHFFVDDKYNLACGCKNRGHWEAYAGGANIPRFFSMWSGKEEKSAAEIFSAAENGDTLCMEFANELARISARGLSTVTAAYNPDCVILDGPVVQNHPWFMEKMTAYVDRYSDVPDFCISKLQGFAPLLGAALLGFSYIPSR